MKMIQVYECAQCEKEFVQRKWICPNCKNTEFINKEVNGKGKIFSHTTIHVSSKEFSHEMPYTIGLIDLVEGLRLTGRITERIEINDNVKCISYKDNMYTFTKEN
jgi:uncharacterized OB-fold protein